MFITEQEVYEAMKKLRKAEQNRLPEEEQPEEEKPEEEKPEEEQPEEEKPEEEKPEEEKPEEEKPEEEQPEEEQPEEEQPEEEKPEESQRQKVQTPPEEIQPKEDKEDSALFFAAERSIDMVKAYCKIERVPKALQGVCISIGLLLYDTENYTGSQKQGALKSMRQGNVSVAYEAVKERFEKEKRKILEGFSEELDRFRMLKW